MLSLVHGTVVYETDFGLRGHEFESRATRSFIDTARILNSIFPNPLLPKSCTQTKQMLPAMLTNDAFITVY